LSFQELRASNSIFLLTREKYNASPPFLFSSCALVNTMHYIYLYELYKKNNLQEFEFDLALDEIQIKIQLDLVKKKPLILN